METLIDNKRLVLQKQGDSTHYCRSNSNERQELANILEESYGKKSVIVPSGMSAISCALTTILNKNLGKKVGIVMSNELYCDTPTLIKKLQELYGTSLDKINVNDNVDVFGAINKNLDKDAIILLIESCTNPSGYIFDFSIIPNLRKIHKNIYFIVDNTWLSYVVFNPFDYGADVVVTSLTKYYSAGKCIAGAILARCGLYLDIAHHVKMNGLHVSPINCQIVLDNISTINDRINKSSSITINLLVSLKSSLKNDKIKLYHPSLKDHPSYEKTIKYFKKSNGKTLYPSVFAFSIPLSKKDSFRWMNNIDIDKETSFGSYNTKFDTYPKRLSDYSTLCRLAIGYDDNTKNIIDRLAGQFKNI